MHTHTHTVTCTQNTLRSILHAKLSILCIIIITGVCNINMHRLGWIHLINLSTWLLSLYWEYTHTHTPLKHTHTHLHTHTCTHACTHTHTHSTMTNTHLYHLGLGHLVDLAKLSDVAALCLCCGQVLGELRHLGLKLAVVVGQLVLLLHHVLQGGLHFALRHLHTERLIMHHAGSCMCVRVLTLWWVWNVYAPKQFKHAQTNIHRNTLHIHTYTHETQSTLPNHPESHTPKHTHKHTVKFTFINTHTRTSTPTNTHIDSNTLTCTHPHPHTHLLMFNVTNALNELHILCVRLPALLPQLLHLCTHFLHLPLKASTVRHQWVHRLVHLHHHHSQTQAGQHQHNMQSGPHEKSFLGGNFKNK